MPISLLALALTTVVALASVSAETVSLPFARPPSFLTAEERLCQLMGTVAAGYVEKRDAGFSLLSSLELWRRRITEVPKSDLNRRLTQHLLDNLRLVYDTPGLTEAENLHKMERLCLHEIAQDGEALRETMVRDGD
jgi:hypothetical protein